MDEPSVFVVRIWPGDKAFRATARAIDDEETLVFSEPLDLLRFLQAGSDATKAATGHGPLSTGSRPPARRNER
jgi:hypothetical protein